MLNHIKNGLTDEHVKVLLELVSKLDPYWFTPKYNGTPYRYKMANVGKYGWYTDPTRYEIDHNGLDFLEIPSIIKDLAKSLGLDNPQAMLVNDYKPGKGKLGLHQDKDEKKRSPIVSLTLGCTGIFVTSSSYHGDQIKYELSNRDIFVFGGPDRMVYHGVEEILNDHEMNRRLNFTIREVK